MLAHIKFFILAWPVTRQRETSTSRATCMSSASPRVTSSSQCSRPKDQGWMPSVRVLVSSVSGGQQRLTRYGPGGPRQQSDLEDCYQLCPRVMNVLLGPGLT